MNRWALSLCLVAAWTWAVPAQAQLEWIGYTQLQAQQQANSQSMPTGAGVIVAQIEASSGSGGIEYYMPATSDPQFVKTPSMTFVPMSGPAGDNSHATVVGYMFYGLSTSAAPGITEVRSYSALAVDTSRGWIIDDYLLAGTIQAPLISPARIANHSWVATRNPGDLPDDPGDELRDILRRVDFVVERDDFIQVAAAHNAPNTANLLLPSYNAIIVGLTNGGHDTTTTNEGGIYTAGRTKPDLVAPLTATSYATPLVAGVAAMLIDAGNSNPSWSQGSYDPHANTLDEGTIGIIQHAATSETIKALLMAGADRVTANSAVPFDPGNITNYARTTDNGLDTRFGAGQVNALNSYNILAAGEQGVDPGLDLSTGWDYEADFGEANEPLVNSYEFVAESDGSFTAALVWNVLIGGPDTLNNLDLALFDITDNQFVQTSESDIDNTENLWTSLLAGHTYRLDVFAADDVAFTFSQDYAIAWQVTPVPEPSSVCLAAVAAGIVLWRRRTAARPSRAAA